MTRWASSVRSAPGNVPAEVNRFVGRRGELGQIKRLFATSRLVTLTGTGGVGKTRLAQRVALDAARAFPDGVWFVELAELRAGECPAALVDLVAGALAIRDRSGRPAIEVLTDHLCGRRLLLVLDGCEHQLGNVRRLVETLDGPDLRILATSRERLGVPGEAVLPVAPLPVPDADRPVAFGEIQVCESVALFVDRATATVPEFRLTPGNCAAVAGICRRLDGLPLAIEVAVAHLRALSAQQLLDRLTDRFMLLDPPTRERQQTLRACIDWSVQLCSEQERRLWARLSMFPDGFTTDAVAGVCADGELPAERLPGLLDGLTSKSILVREPGGRFRMLDSIRAYGREKLDGGPDRGWLATRHRDWYASLVATAGAEWISDRQPWWQDRLSRERPNLRHAIEHCLDRPGEAEAALRIIVGLPAQFWWGRGLYREGGRWLTRALREPTGDGPLRARALLLAGRLAFADRDVPGSVRLLSDGEALAARLGATDALAFAAFLRGTRELFRNELTASIATFEDALTLLAYGSSADLDTRLHLLFTYIAALGLAGRTDRAEAAYREVLALTEPAGEVFHRSSAMWARGLAAWCQGEVRQASALQIAALRLKHAHRLDDPLGTALALEVLAWVAAEQGRARRAATLLDAATAMLIDLGIPITTFGHLVAHHERCVARLGPAFADGRGDVLSAGEVLASVLRERRSAPSPGQAPLTSREREVARLVAEGLSNQQIARRLVISPRTADSHVLHILQKRGFTSRAQIAAWVGADHR